MADRSLSAAQLIRLAVPLRLSATNVKSHLTRMVAEGTLQRHGPPRLSIYSPSPVCRATIEGIRARLTLCEEPWDGDWMMMAIRNDPNRGKRTRLRAALWFDGWRSICPNVFVRPAWPDKQIRDSIDVYPQHTFGFCVRGAIVAAPLKLGTLYDLQGLDAAAKQLATWINRKSPTTRSPQMAFVDRMKVGGRVAQFIGHDPRLPAEIWGQRRGMRDLVSAFHSYEERVAPEAQIFLEESIEGSNRT
jgi:DNA-binding transcriptional regulator PaaX